MNLQTLVFVLIPLVAFAVLDSYLPPKQNVVWTLILTIILTAISFFLFDDFDTMYLIEIGMLVIFGAITFLFDESRYFKFQPVAVGLVTALYFAFFQWQGTPVLIRLLPLSTKMSPQLSVLAQDPRFLKMLSDISFQIIFIFLAQSAWVAYQALRGTTWRWVLARLSIYPLLIIDALANQLIAYSDRLT